MSTGLRVAAAIGATCFAGACTVQLPGGPEPSEPSPRVVTTVLPPQTVVITPPPVVAPPQAPYPASGTHDCSVLSAQGMTFEQMVQYWYSLGAPTDMDNDADGIPCETIYGEQN